MGKKKPSSMQKTGKNVFGVDTYGFPGAPKGLKLKVGSFPTMRDGGPAPSFLSVKKPSQYVTRPPMRPAPSRPRPGVESYIPPQYRHTPVPAPGQPGGAQSVAPLPDLGGGGYDSFSYGGAPNLDAFLKSRTNIDALFGKEFQGFANQRHDLDKRKADALVQIGRAYAGAGQQMTEGRGQVDQKFAQEQKDAAARGVAAQQAINSGALSSVLGENAVNANLGIQGGVDLSNSEADRAFYAAQQAKQTEGAGNSMGANRTNAFKLGTENITATGLRSAEEKAASGKGYDSAIAQLLDKEQQFRSQAQADARSAAMQEYQAALSGWQDSRDMAYKNFTRNQDLSREDAKNALDYQIHSQDKTDMYAMEQRKLDADMQAKMAATQYTQSQDARKRMTDADLLRERLLSEGVSGGKISDWLQRGQANQSIGAHNGIQKFMGLFGGSAGAEAALQEYFAKQGYFK